MAERLDRWPSDKIEPDFAFRGSTRFREVVHRRYTLDDGSVTVFVGTADLGQRGGSPLSPITARPGSGWLLRETGEADVEGVPHPVDSYLFEKGKQRVLVHHWYAGRRGLAQETLRSLLAIDRSPARRRETLYVVRLEASIEGRDSTSLAAAEARLDRMESALQPVLDELDALSDAARAY